MSEAQAPDRIERLRTALTKRDLDAMVAAGTDATTHLCGYWRYFGSPTAVVVDREGERTLVVQSDEAEAARAGSYAEHVVAYGSRGFGLVPDQQPLLAAAVASVKSVAGASCLGVASGGIQFPALLRPLIRAEVENLDTDLRALALIKDADELARIGDAYRLAWAAQRAVRDAAAPGVSEIELFTTGLAAAQNAAGEPIVFVGDLLCGERSAEVCAPVRVAGRTRVEPGDAIIVDLTVGHRGYFGDTAETIAPDDGGVVAETRSELTVILEQAARLLTPGRLANEVFAAMRDAIAETFTGGEFPHHGGHGVGISPFADPHVIPEDTTPLAAGMVIALEPGVYFKGRFGARIERMYVVADSGGVEIGQEHA